MIYLVKIFGLSGRIRPVLKVVPRRAEPSEFRSILPGSTRRDSYETNLILGSTKSNHAPKVSRLGRPGATYKTNFSRAKSNFSFNERMYSKCMKLKRNFPKSVSCAFVIMVRHDTARQKFSSYKTEEALQVEPQSNSNSYGSARRGAARRDL